VITSWIDLGGAALLWMAGLYHMSMGQTRVQRGSGRWRDDPGALLASLLGGVLFAMGLALCAYSVCFAALSEGILSR
jgi:hypothetical protein